MDIILYGCGARAQFIFDSVIEYVNIVGACDKNQDNLHKFCQKNHLQMLEIESLDMKNGTVLVTSNKYYDDICAELVTLGICRDNILDVSGLNTILIDQIHPLKLCNICNSKVFDWIYVGSNNVTANNERIIGGGYRRGGCPVCGCNDRERFVYDYINNRVDMHEKSVLHFAPERKLGEYLRAHSSKYISADLSPGRADVVEDIRALSFKNNQFDVIICNHVLEHIDDDRKALLEIYRCLTSDGIVIITSPICWETNTIENKCVNTDEERIELYGQADHVRLYGRDFEERLRTVGFDVKCIRCRDIERANCHGFINGDAIFICKRTN